MEGFLTLLAPPCPVVIQCTFLGTKHKRIWRNTFVLGTNRIAIFKSYGTLRKNYYLMLIKRKDLEHLLADIKDAERNYARVTLKYKHICIFGPSGSGKTTLVRTGQKSIVNVLPNVFSFAVSGTTRKLRANEVHGTDYFHFPTVTDFEMEDYIETNPYTGNNNLYGTLASEVERIAITEKKKMALDLDANGGKRVKEIFGDNVLLVNLNTSLPVLRRRLEKRLWESNRSQEEIEAEINKRLHTAEKEHLLVKQGFVKPDVIIPYDDMPVERAVQRILSEAVFRKKTFVY